MTDRLVEDLGASLADVGLPSLPSRVLAALLLGADGEMTSAELAAVLGHGPAAVSDALTFLTDAHLVRRERRPADGADLHVVEDDALPTAMLHAHVTLAAVLRALGAAIDEQGPRSPAYRRLMLNAEFLKVVDRELDGLAARWETHRTTFERGL